VLRSPSPDGGGTPAPSAAGLRSARFADAGSDDARAAVVDDRAIDLETGLRSLARMLKDSFSRSLVRWARRGGTWSAGVNRSSTVVVATSARRLPEGQSVPRHAVDADRANGERAGSGC
jgi:hypothetical protein